MRYELTDYERAANYLAFIQLASVRLGCALMSPRLVAR